MFLIINWNGRETKEEGKMIHFNAVRGEELGMLSFQTGNSD